MRQERYRDISSNFAVVKVKKGYSTSVVLLNDTNRIIV